MAVEQNFTMFTIVFDAQMEYSDNALQYPVNLIRLNYLTIKSIYTFARRPCFISK